MTKQHYICTHKILPLFYSPLYSIQLHDYAALSCGLDNFAKVQDQVFSLSCSVQVGLLFSMAKPLHVVN